MAADGLCGDAEIVRTLQIQPEFRAVAEPVAEPQGRVAGDGPPAADDLADPVGRHRDLTGKFGRRHMEFLELVSEDFSRMNGRTGHDFLCSRQSAGAVSALLSR